MLTQFVAENPDISVTTEIVDWNTLYTKLQAAFVAGTPPDLIMLHASEIPQFASYGVLKDLGDFTIAIWVYCNAEATHTRIFDFGSSDIAYMALEPRDNQGRMRFMVTGTHFRGEGDRLRQMWISSWAENQRAAG